MRPSDNVARWERLRKALKGHVQKKLATVIKKTHVAQEWAIEAHKKRLAKGEKLEELPLQYRKFADIFNEEKSHRFPPSRPEDHAIVLREGAPPSINCKVFALNKDKEEATKKFIAENSTLGYIEPSNSPWSSPWFFIKKKDGNLCPVKDYQTVNEWTVHNVFPIPCIEQILESLHRCTLFTALDIRWGYHNI